MAYDESLANRIRQLFARKKGVVEKKMFGGVGFLLDGNMCVGVWKDSLIARIGPERYEKALQQAFVGEFNITGRAMKGWVLVAPEGIADDDQLQEWIERAVKFLRNGVGRQSRPI